MTARALWSRTSRCADDAVVEWAAAVFGGAYAADAILGLLAGAGARCVLSALCFTSERRFIDVSSRIRHLVPNTSSDAIIKSAAVRGGRGRAIGDIVIEAAAHGSRASLRADALLLSKDAHLDCVPALEIAANEVSAFPRRDDRDARRGRALLRAEPRHRALRVPSG